jgi:exopolysaccharide production protein ExoQ
MRNSMETLPAPAPMAMWNLLLGWLILLPLLFFSTNGAVVPDTGDVAMRAAEPSGTALSHRLGLAAITLLCSTLIFTRLPSVFAIGQRMKLIVALPILALMSSLWSGSARQTLMSGVVLLVFTLFALYIGSSFEPDGQFELLMLAGGVALALSIGLAMIAPGLGAPGHSWRGIFAHKQNCAAVSTFLLVTAIHWRASGTYQQIYRAGYAAMCCVMIVMSQSRTGWALALLAVSISASLWLLQKMPPRDALVAFLLGVAVFAGAAYLVYDHASVLLPAVGKDPTLSERTVIWAASWTTIAKQPILGYGYGAFWTGLTGPSLNIVLISGWVLAQAQNGFLDMWLQVGVAGVVLILLATGQALRNAIRSFRASGRDSYVRWCIVVILCTLVYNIGESSLGMVQLVWFLFLLACIGLKETAIAKHAKAIDGQKQNLFGSNQASAL